MASDTITKVLIALTGVIHLLIGISQLVQKGFSFLDFSLLLNGIGFLGLLLAIYFGFLPGTFGERIREMKWLLLVYTLITIIAYFAVWGMDGFTSPVGLLTKAIEVGIVILVFMDLRNPSSGS